MTTATATQTTIGRCAWAGHAFIAHAPAEKATYCPTCAPFVGEAYGQEWVQRSMIKWTAVKVRVTATKCSDVCRSAKSDRCACECGGEHHGEALGLAW